MLHPLALTIQIGTVLQEHPEHSWQREPATGHSNGPSTVRHCRTIEVEDNGKQAMIPDLCCFVATPGAPSEQQTKVEILQHAIVLVSITEQALCEASRVRVPMKCFGSQGLQAYDKNCFHQFKDCPNKNDSKV